MSQRQNPLKNEADEDSSAAWNKNKFFFAEILENA